MSVIDLYGTEPRFDESLQEFAKRIGASMDDARPKWRDGLTEKWDKWKKLRQEAEVAAGLQ